MTHDTGPRKKVVDDLVATFAQVVDASSRANRTSITEALDATFHEQERLLSLATPRWPDHMRRLFQQKLAVQQESVMELTKTALAPWEDETCPTCPRQEMTPADHKIEGELRDVDANMKQPDEGLTLGRRAADELARRGYAITRKRELLRECLEAMNDATRRYRTMAELSGNSTDVPGWVAWLDQMQEKVTAELYREVQR